MDGIHDRMPVILEQGAWDHWLDPDLIERDDLESMLQAAPEGTLVHYPVGPDVGNIRNDRPELLQPAARGPSPRPAVVSDRPTGDLGQRSGGGHPVYSTDLVIRAGRRCRRSVMPGQNT